MVLLDYKRSQKKNAFTLIELLIVVAIVALIAVFAIYNMTQAITRSKVSRTLAELSRFETIRRTGGKIPEKDPWGNPYSRNSQRLDYSFGPDLQDDGGLIIYDPSNGTSSKGDIFIPR